MRAIAAIIGVDAADAAAPQLLLRQADCTDWASITLVGQRHDLDIALLAPRRLAPALATRVQAQLAEREIPLHGQFIADIAVVIAEPDAEAAAVSLLITALAIYD
jgi:hypothetical protein